VWTGLWAAFASIFVGFIGGRLLPRPLSTIVTWVGFIWMGAFGLLLSGVAASDLVLLGLRLAGRPLTDGVLELRALVVVAVVLPTLLFAALVARKPGTRRVEVTLDSLPKALDGFTIAQLSDVHIGETLGKDFAQMLVEQVNRLEADVVAITGDLVDGGVHKLSPEVAPFAELKGKHGVYFVTGNHEYYSGASEWEAELERLGLTVLHNEHRVLESGGEKLVLAGVTDLEGANFSSVHRPDAAAAFSGAPRGPPRILLAHQPRFAKRAQGLDVSLMLSGHTHGGQMFPFMFLVRLQQPVIAGLKLLHGVLTYTSNGTGYWGPPFRLGPRGEVTQVVLRSSGGGPSSP